MKRIDLAKITKITNGRFGGSRVFTDFLEYAAIHISNRVDLVHREERTSKMLKLMQSYSETEQDEIRRQFDSFAELINRTHLDGKFSDFLSSAFSDCRLTQKGQDLTPSDISKLIAKLTCAKIPDIGYITLDEPACGCGALVLSMAEDLLSKGYSPYQQMVVRATDLDLKMVHATYIQLSLYGIPAVVIHGNTLTLEEFSRWYTPMYVVYRWVFKKPMSLNGERNACDEALKRISDPMYGAIRKAQDLMG